MMDDKIVVYNNGEIEFKSNSTVDNFSVVQKLAEYTSWIN